MLVFKICACAHNLRNMNNDYFKLSKMLTYIHKKKKICVVTVNNIVCCTHDYTIFINFTIVCT